VRGISVARDKRGRLKSPRSIPVCRHFHIGFRYQDNHQPHTIFATGLCERGWLKLANGHGGKRSGAGRPRKSLADKKLEGMYGKRRPTVLNFPEQAEEYKLEYPKWLDNLDSKLEGLPTIEEFWDATVDWLEKTGCLHLINPMLIADYVVAKIRHYENEITIAVSNTIYRSKVNDIRVDINPAVEASVTYKSQADAAWDRIWAIVTQNSEAYYGDDPSHDLMSRLLSNKPR
jgi:hypothetical protein